MTEATILTESSAWRVAGWTCRLVVEERGADLVATTRWAPFHPTHLDHFQCDELRAGRAAAKAEIEAALGRGVRLA